MIVNQSFARRYLGGLALGARLPSGAYRVQGREAAEWTVIGIVDDVRYVTTADALSLSCSTAIVKWQGGSPWER